ncbi:MAG: ABC transporter permease [Clostridia bacterium]|nr:ABC transporter permease [Clostridia bacterium]
MHKLGSLYRNEITKAVRKPVYIVLTALVVASMLLIGVVALISQLLSSSGIFYSSLYNVDYLKEEIEWNESGYADELQTLDQAFKETNALFSDPKYTADGKFDAGSAVEDYRANYGDKISWHVDSLYQYALRIESYNLMIENDDSKDPVGFISETRDTLSSIKAYERVKKDVDGLLKEYPVVSQMFAEDGEIVYSPSAPYVSAIAFTQYKEKYEKILADEDFDAYIDMQNEAIKADDTLTEGQKKISLEKNDILKKLYRPNMTQDEWDEVTTRLKTLNQNEMLLETGRDWNGDKLSASTIKQYKLQNEEITKGLECGAPGFGGKQSSDKQTFIKVTLTLGAAVSQVLILVMGALLVAEEMQTGSVKLLIIAPVKRIKIFTAKLLMLATACVFEMLLVYVTLMFVCLFSGLGFSNMVFTFAGSAHVLNPFLYYLLYVFLTFIEIFATGSFALMLSTLIRNAGGAISISMVSYYVLQNSLSTIFMFVIGFSDSYVFRNIYKVLPVANSDLPSKFFETSLTDNFDIVNIMMGDYGFNIGNGFFVALAYTLVFSALFIWVSYESFIKRDIK